MRLEEIRNNPAVMMHLCWDLTKEKLERTTFNREDAGFYFCIYVKNGRACLALLHYYPDGKATQEPLAGFPEDMILAAIKEAGGSIEVSGYYPINHPIEEMLRLGLYASGKGKAGQSRLTELNAEKLLAKFYDMLNKLHGGSYFHRFHDIARERGRPQVRDSHFYKLDTVSMQLLVETIQALTSEDGACCTKACGAVCPLIKEG